MAHPTDDVERMHKMAQDHEAARALFTPDQVTEPEIPQGTITVEIEGGAVTAVRGLPENYQYEVLDHDVQEHESEALYLGKTATDQGCLCVVAGSYAVDDPCGNCDNVFDGT